MSERSLAFLGRKLVHDDGRVVRVQGFADQRRPLVIVTFSMTKLKAPRLEREGASARALHVGIANGVDEPLRRFSEIVQTRPSGRVDLVRVGDPILITKGRQTRSLKQWDRIAPAVFAYRLVQMHISGPFCRNDREASEKVLKLFRMSQAH